MSKYNFAQKGLYSKVPSITNSPTGNKYNFSNPNLLHIYKTNQALINTTKNEEKEYKKEISIQHKLGTNKHSNSSLLK